MKETKELKELIKAINTWAEKHDYNVGFVGTFFAFKGKNCKVIDDRIFACGDKSTLRECLKDIDEQIENEKEDFICW